jgi:predicted PolB exonuclease-like 3'-5' exonuclease
MSLAVFAIASVPDTETTRRLYDLHDLDDKAVSKVLFHRRKQQTGSSEELRWDQRALVGLSLIRQTPDGIAMQTLAADEGDEHRLLDAYYATVTEQGRLLSWDGTNGALPLLHFRSLQHGMSQPRYWERQQGDWHVDLRAWLCPSGHDAPSLDEIALKLGFPGMRGVGDKQIYDAWLAREMTPVRTFTDYAVLNTFLIGLRWQLLTGQQTAAAVARYTQDLRERLQQRRESHLDSFLTAWSDR